MNLKDRLKLLHKKQNPTAQSYSSDIRSRLDMLLNPRTVFKKQAPAAFLEQLTGVQMVTTEHGDVFFRESIESLLTHKLDDSACKQLQGILTKDRAAYDLEKTLFLDTETTGLSGGTGNYAFMAGAGFFERGSFVVRQFFLTEYQFEKAMLHTLESLFNQYPHIVTFNGKSFDVPLLINRFVMCRIETCLHNIAHTDLVYPARTLWKGKLDSLRFSSIEKEIFQYTRTQDIDGSMIPDVYFAYQRHGRTENLKEVFHHNLIDVVNLVRLYQEVANRFCYPSGYSCTSVAVARYLFDRDRDKAVAILESGLNKPDGLNDVYQAKKLLAHHYKAQGRYNQAVQHWKDMISLDQKAEVTPFIELAKYYEHVAKDLHKARHMMHLIDSLNFSYDKALENRKQRIEEKYKKCQRLALSSPRALSF